MVNGYHAPRRSRVCLYIDLGHSTKNLRKQASPKETWSSSQRTSNNEPQDGSFKLSVARHVLAGSLKRAVLGELACLPSGKARLTGSF